jgi:transposase
MTQDATLPAGGRQALASLHRQLTFVEGETAELDHDLAELAETERYKTVTTALQQVKGVGVLTALVYRTEMGDLRRFRNRQQVGSYLGLTPSSNESGKRSDCKGHITRQGPSRVRRVLCQAAWSQVRTDPKVKAYYQALAARNPQHKKVALVALMRRLGIRLWHLGIAAMTPIDPMKASVEPIAAAVPPPACSVGKRQRQLVSA